MNILYLTFYFEPDLCAGSFRNTPLALELGKLLDNKGSVEVFTTLPNRYKSYNEEAPEFEDRGSIKITRVPIPVHKSGFFDQMFSFRKYYRKVLKVVDQRNYDLVFASSSRLFTAYLGYKVACKKRLPLYLDIRDIFTENMSEIIKSKLVKSGLMPLLGSIEKKIFNYAKHINLVSPGFKEHFEKFDCANYSYYTNGIDKEFIDVNFNNSRPRNKPVIITYAGNIGKGQGLDRIIPDAAKVLGEEYQFNIIGDGGAKEDLVQEVKKLNLKNVVYHPPVKRNKLIEAYQNSDFLFLHLNSYQAFEKVLPSKIFEYGAVGKPIIAGVKGSAEEFLREHLPDTILFSPGNVAEMVSKIKSYSSTPISREDFINSYARHNIVNSMARSILATR